MFHSLLSLVPVVVGSDGGGRGRRRRPRQPRPSSEELGKWIWAGGANRDRNSYIHARRLFSLSSKPTSAILRATAEGKYKLFVNGRYVGKGPARTYVGCVSFDTYDVTDLLTKGKNVIAFLSHHFGEPTYHGIPRRPGLNCRLDVELPKEAITITSDEEWKIRRAAEWSGAGNLIGGGLGFQEVYDAEARVEKWNEIKLNEKGWEDAVVLAEGPGAQYGRLVPREVPHLREETVLPQAVVGTFNAPALSPETLVTAMPEIIATTDLSPLSSGSIKNVESLLSQDGQTHVRMGKDGARVIVILDFGREVFGNVEVGIAGSGTGSIDLGYAEVLQDSRVKPDRGGLNYADRISLKKGELDWQSFEPRAFRFLQIEFRSLSKVAAVKWVRVNQSTCPLEHTGSFECSDDLLNRIWDMGAYTTELCTEDAYIVSPRSDRGQAWAAVRALSRAAFYISGDTQMLAHSIRLAADSQRGDGRIPGILPVLGDESVPDFALLWVFSLLDYFAFSDDESLLKDMYPVVRRLMRWFAQHTNEDGLLSHLPGRPFIDRADLERRGELTALNCLYYQALRVTAAIATIMGFVKDAEDYAEQASWVKLTINKLLYSRRRGLYGEGLIDGELVEKYSKQANALAALFDVADHYQKQTICRQLLQGPLPEVATPYFASYVLEALYASDLHTEALDVIRHKWGAMAQQDATTCWENLDQSGDACFGWSVCPTRGLIAEYVGIKPVLGANRFSVAPHSGDLSWARGSIGTKNGPLAVEWSTGRNQMLIEVHVPQGLKVDVYPPGPPECKITLNGKSHASRLVTLSEGRHQVKVTIPPPPRPPKLDKSLEPAPFPHVEILDEVMPRGLRRLRIGGLRERPTRRRGSKTDVPVSEGETDEVVEQTELEERVPIDASEEPRKRSRRGRRGSGRGARETGPAAAESAEAQPVESAEHVEAAEPAEHTDQERRRRSRRGRRGSGRGAREAEQAVAPTEAPEPVEQVQAAEPKEPTEQERKRRSRRSRRGSGRGAREAEQAVAPTEAPEPVEQVHAVEPTEPGEQEHKRRSRRGRRGSGRGSREAEQAATPAEAPEPAEQVHAVEPTEPGEQEHKRRSRRGRRGSGRGARTEGAPEQETHAEPVAQEQPHQEAPPVEHTEAAPSKPRSRPRRKRPSASEAGEAGPEQTTAPVEHHVEAPPPAPVPSDEAQPSEAPKRRRSTTPRAPRRRTPPTPEGGEPGEPGSAE